MALSFSVSTVSGQTYDILCTDTDTVKTIRNELQKQIEVPPASYLKIFHQAEVLCDSTPVTDMDPSQPLFAVVARETNVEILLQAAGSYSGYKELLKSAPSSSEGDHIKILKGLPSILAVLEDMGGQKPDVTDLVQGEHGLELKGPNGHLLLPSLNIQPLQSLHNQKFVKAVFSVQLNSDAYNQGLGVVFKQPSSMEGRVGERGLPMYIYSGMAAFEKNDMPNWNAIKFHPGMPGGQLRIEGAGGSGNREMNFDPANWTGSGRRFHTLQVTVDTDGKNLMRFTGTQGEVYEDSWVHKLTDGKFLPALIAWLDMGGGPLFIGEISLEIHLEPR